MPLHLATSPREKLYWTGNIAKARVIREILAELQLRKRLLILDYGCGAGGIHPPKGVENPGALLVMLLDGVRLWRSPESREAVPAFSSRVPARKRRMLS